MSLDYENSISIDFTVDVGKELGAVDNDLPYSISAYIEDSNGITRLAYERKDVYDYGEVKCRVAVSEHGVYKIHVYFSTKLDTKYVMFLADTNAMNAVLTETGTCELFKNILPDDIKNFSPYIWYIPELEPGTVIQSIVQTWPPITYTPSVNIQDDTEDAGSGTIWATIDTNQITELTNIYLQYQTVYWSTYEDWYFYYETWTDKSLLFYDGEYAAWFALKGYYMDGLHDSYYPDYIYIYSGKVFDYTYAICTLNGKTFNKPFKKFNTTDAIIDAARIPNIVSTKLASGDTVGYSLLTQLPQERRDAYSVKVYKTNTNLILFDLTCSYALTDNVEFALYDNIGNLIQPLWTESTRVAYRSDDIKVKDYKLKMYIVSDVEYANLAAKVTLE